MRNLIVRCRQSFSSVKAVLQEVADKAAYGLLLLLSILLPLSYHPYVVDMSIVKGVEVGSVLHPFIYVDFLLLFALSLLDKSVLDFKEGFVSCLFVLFVLLSSVLTAVFFGTQEMFSDMRAIIICIVAMMIGWKLNLNECRMLILVLVFASSALFVGLSQVFIRGDGFNIIGYFADQKNALGPLLATASLSCLILVFRKMEKHECIVRLILLMLAVLCVFVVLTIRARAALLAWVVLVAVFLFQNYKGKYILLMMVAGLLLMLLVFAFLPTSLTNYVLQSLFMGYDGDFTSGRMIRNEWAWSVICDNPLFGNLLNGAKWPIAHNYLIAQVYTYGFLFALPMICCYLYLLVIAIRNTIGQRDRVDAVGCYAVLLLFVVSLFEYTFPYGPSTATVMNFVLLGVTYRKKYEDLAMKQPNMVYVEKNRVSL